MTYRIKPSTAEQALTAMLDQCAPITLAGLSASSLSESYNIPLPRTTALLADARRRAG